MPHLAPIALPLQPRDKPIELPASYQKSLRNELHVRYLETLGVAPSKANLAMVREHIPASKCKFKTAWKSRGWISDTLYITLEDPAQAAQVLATRRAAQSAADASVIDRLPGALLGDDMDKEEEEEETTQEVLLQAPNGAMSFSDAQRNFLYPYKYVNAPKAQRTRVGAGSSQRAGEHDLPFGEGHEDGAPLVPSGTFDFASRDVMRYAPFTEREILEELAQPLELHTKDITKLQADFIESLPFDRLIPKRSRTEVAQGGAGGSKAAGTSGARPGPARTASVNAKAASAPVPFASMVSMKSMISEPAPPADPLEAAIRAELSSARTARFIGMLALFLYWAHMPERCQLARDDAKLAKLLCAVQQYFAALRRRMMSRRSSLMVVLPALLLSARSTIEALFRAAYKKWWTTVDGRATLAAMDQTIEEVLDPCSYHTHIAALESSTEAIKIAARQETGVKPRGTTWARHLATSTLVSTALPTAPLVLHRNTLLAGDRLPETEQEMARLATPSVQQTLLRVARTRPSAKLATAEATRAIETMISRPAQGAGPSGRSGDSHRDSSPAAVRRIG